MALRRSETDIILLAIARRKQAFARLGGAARACADPRTKRLLNQLALDQLKSLLGLLSVMDGLVDDWLTHLDFTLPRADLPETSVQGDEGVLVRTVGEEEQPQTSSSPLPREVDREELLDLLESLRVEEEDHRTRLQSLWLEIEADRPVVAKQPSIHSMLPAGHRD